MRSLSANTPSDSVNGSVSVSVSVSEGDKETTGGEVEEPLYASVNPFTRTGKLVDLDDSPADG